MLLVACATMSPTTASAKYPHATAGAVAAARRPPIRADVSVMEKTQARVISSQRDTGSMARSRGRLPVATIWRQLSSSPLSPGAAVAVRWGRTCAMRLRLGAPAGWVNRSRGLLDAHHHGVVADQVHDRGLAKPDLAHPACAVRAGVVEAAAGLDQHVQAHEETEGVPAALVVDDRLVDDQRASGIERRVRLAQEHSLLVEVPVVEDVTHDEDVGAGQGIGEEVPGLEAKAIGEPEG